MSAGESEMADSLSPERLAELAISPAGVGKWMCRPLLSRTAKWPAGIQIGRLAEENVQRLQPNRTKDTQDVDWHLDYIHYNPVKHGLAQRLRDWP
jgi:putative transposase